MDGGSATADCGGGGAALSVKEMKDKKVNLYRFSIGFVLVYVGIMVMELKAR